ncbi:MAG: hypothetical protein HY543_03080, partial [Deltaproteobacteria bacterium]|nr:hypothetical protein [Deltaproteobacteria bacterium]
LLERIPVLAVDRLMEAPQPDAVGDAAAAPASPSRRGENTVTLALTPEQAQRVIFATEVGRVRLTLRPQDEPEGAMLAPRDPATAAGVTGMTSLLPRKEYRGR